MRELLLVFVLINLTLYSSAQICGTPGLDGSGNISGSINTYYPLAGDVVLTAGARSVTLAAVPPNDPHGNNFGTKPISAGDMLLIIQMQDATIQASDDQNYGSNKVNSGPDGLGGTGFTSLGNSGLFEYVIATNTVPLTGGNLTFKGAGAGKGIINSYINAAETAARGKRTFQVVRIPQYSNLIISSQIFTPPFNGVAGGIIAFDVSGTMNFNGFTIDASSKGFRGGYGPVSNSGNNLNYVYMIPSTDNRSVGKGEGIAGTPRYMWDGYNQVDNQTEGLPGGSYGKGAPANAGGGGNDHNAGGGGGGNGGNGGVGGNGVSVVSAGFAAFPNGGRPGSITYTSANPDISRIIMGGGGGGGDANNALNGVKGGVGGGIILINVGRIIGNGTILANGGKGAVGAAGNQPDGAGGGGAGGTVFIKVSNPDPDAVLEIQTKGGFGGNTASDNNNEHGTGGGGGGGQVFYAMSSGTVNVDFSKGIAGKTNSGNGINHGASDGTDGNKISFVSADLPAYLQGGGSACYPALTTTLSEADPAGVKFPGSQVVYTVTATNAGGGNAGGVQIETQLPAGISFKSAIVTYTGDSGGPVIIANVLGTTSRPILGDFNVSPGDAVIITLTAQVDCVTAPSTYHASAQSLYLDPSRTINDPNRRITSNSGAFTGSKVNYETGSGGLVPGANFDGNGSSVDNVIVQPAPPLGNNGISISGDPVKFCVSTMGDLVDPMLITGTVPTGDIGVYTYQWQRSIDNIIFVDIISANAINYDPQPISATSFYRRMVTSSTCTAPIVSNVVKVLITLLPIADFKIPDFCLRDGTANFINNSSIADGTSSQLTYLWDFGEAVSGVSNTSTQQDGAHSYSLQGEYWVTLTVTSKDGCVTSKRHSFTVNGSMRKADFIVINALKLCSSIPVQFEDLAEAYFGEITKIEWYYDDANNPAQVEVDETPGLRASPKVYSHIYPLFNTPSSKPFKVRMVAYSGASCVMDAIKTITLYAMPEVQFDAIPPICLENENSVFRITQATEKFGVEGTGTYSGTGVSVNGLFNPKVAGPGNHIITYTFASDAGDCSDSKSQNIIVYANPVIKNESLEILEGGEIKLPPIASTEGLIYRWSPSSFLSASDILCPVASPVESTDYVLTIIDKITGCNAVGTIKVIVHKIPEIPNVFTPNGDGINDYWEIKHLNTYTDCTVRVFNRYGNQVFSSKGYGSPWDGRYKGSEIASGTYYYIIDPQSRKSISGSVTVLR